jgi:hypothetical protein
MALPRTVQHFGGLVAAAVVDHDDFGVIGRKKHRGWSKEFAIVK